MGLANVNATCVQTTISVAHFMNFQPSLKEIRDTVTAFNLFIRDLGHVISIFSCQEAHDSYWTPVSTFTFDSDIL